MRRMNECLLRLGAMEWCLSGLEVCISRDDND